MSAAETIAAAIEKLESLRGLDGTWTLQGGNEWIHPIGITVAPDDGGVTTRQADLIVTLHRTIDAQLAILRDALAGLQPGWAGMVQPDENYELQADLARAILGEVA